MRPLEPKVHRSSKADRIVSPMNMRTIARRAGVSSATVSRVINGSSLVRTETAKRIRELLEEVNYIPNPSATTLKYGRSRTVGLVIPDLRNPFYAEFLAEFEDLLVESEQELLLTNVQSPEKLVKSVRRMLMRRVDGAVLMGSEFDTKAVEPLFDHKVPLVTIDRRSVRIGCSDVAIDFEGGFLQAVQYLRELGHRRVGFIGGTEGLRTSRIRLRAFQKAIAKCDLVFYEGFVRNGNYRVAGGSEAILSLMHENKEHPTAILTANDLTAFGVIRGLQSLGLSVPGDVSVVGTDDLLLSEVLQPSLTTIRIPRRRMAEACLKALAETNKVRDHLGFKYSVPSELVIRESTAPLRRGNSR